MNATLMENNSRATATAEIGGQYSLARILGFWALAACSFGWACHSWINILDSVRAIWC
jgi:hypothetical protein